MYSLLFLTVVSFALCLVLTPLVRRVFLHFGIVDHPDHIRKLHSTPIVRVGGIAVVISYMVPFGLLVLFRFEAESLVLGALPIAVKLLPSIVIIFLTGLIDDLSTLKPWQKLLGQLAAATAAYFAGIQITVLGAAHLPYWCSYPLTTVWLLATINSLNLIDGLDGLAAGIGFFASVTVSGAALLQGNFGLAFATLPLASSLLAFLRYNFNPAKVFLGDSGSLFIGLLLGCYGVLWSQKSVTVVGMCAPVLAISVPLIDTSLAVVRRLLRRSPIFGADRGHIHHRLLDLGFTPKRAVLLLYAVCALSSLFALSMLHHAYGIPALIVFCVAASVGIRQLRIAEIGAATELVRQGTFQRLVDLQVSVKRMRERLVKASTPEDCWVVLRESYRDFGCTEIVLDVCGKTFADSTRRTRSDECCSMKIPISIKGYLTLQFESADRLSHYPIVPFGMAIQHVLAQKFQFLEHEDNEEIGLAAARW